MTFDCKVYQYDERSERWQLRATYADPIAAHVDRDGIAIPASDFDGPAIDASSVRKAAKRAVGLALDKKRIEPDFGDGGCYAHRVLVTDGDGMVYGYTAPLRVVVGDINALDGDATAALADPLRRNEQ